MNLITTGLMGAGGLAITIFGVQIAKDIAKKAAEKFKQKESALKWFLVAEKAIPGATGDEKFSYVKAKILQYMPDQFDKMTDAGLQAFYDEIKPEIELERSKIELEAKGKKS